MAARLKKNYTAQIVAQLQKSVYLKKKSIYKKFILRIRVCENNFFPTIETKKSLLKFFQSTIKEK